MTKEEFKSIRLARKWSQPKMARELGVTVTTIWRWENEKPPTTDLSLKAIERLVAQHPVEVAA